MVIGLILAALLAAAPADAPAPAPARCLFTSTLEWRPSFDEDVAGYLLERSDDGGVTWRSWLRVAQGPGPFFDSGRRAFRVADSSALDSTRYRLSAVDALGNASGAVDLAPVERETRRCIR